MINTLAAQHPLISRGKKGRFHSLSLPALLALLMSVSGCESGMSGDVSLYWNPPLERVNGELLDPANDIRGYEIRYRHSSDSSFQTVFLSNSSIDSYHFDEIRNPSDYVFQIAVVDKNGLYSDFVTAQR